MKESVESGALRGAQPLSASGIKDELFEKRDIHIHVPDGATPKMARVPAPQ